MTTKLTLTHPDDYHLHLRDGDILQKLLPYTAQAFERAIIMPNLRPPITSVKEANAYRERIMRVLPEEMSFTPLMTLYLTDKTTVDEIKKAKDSGIINAIKLYPAGATTNSDAGVTNFDNVQDVFEAMIEANLPLLIHGEVTDPDVDVFDKEAVFVETILDPLHKRVPELKIVLEHISCKESAQYITEANESLAATVTAHHLLMNRNDIFRGGINPHHYCLPILKSEDDRQAIVKAATSGNPKFFLGTDSAPHPQSAKEGANGFAGVYTASVALPLYAEAFEAVGALDKLEAFASFYGADFYGLPRNSDTITLAKEEWQVPESHPLESGVVIPVRAGTTLAWKVL